MSKTLMAALFMLVLVFPPAGTAQNAEMEPLTAQLEAKGTIVALTSRSISLEIAGAEGESEELLLPYGKETRLIGLKQVKELQRGATVQVKYEQKYVEKEDGEKEILGTDIKEINLIRSGGSRLMSKEQAS